MFTHGHQAGCLLLSTIVSIPKDARGNLCDDTNYRGIALCNAIGKVVHYIIIERNQQKLKTSSLQFAYKSRMGTTMCSLVVKEIIGYYLRRGSNVYSSCLDMSKAFDLVKHDLLFGMLVKKGLSSVDLNPVSCFIAHHIFVDIFITTDRTVMKFGMQTEAEKIDIL